MAINIKLLLDIYHSMTKEERESILTNSVPEVVRELARTLQDTKNILSDKAIGNVIEFVLSNNRWNEYGIYGSKRDQNRTVLRGRKINRGRLIFIDFGHNIGVELSFPHLGIVIGNFPKTVVVVPVRTDRGKPIEEDFEDAVIKVKSVDYPQFDNDSELMIHQIRAVDKNRILRDTGKSIAETDLMQQIEEAVYKSFLKYLYSINEDIKKERDALRLQLEQKNALLQEIRSAFESGLYEEVAATLQKGSLF